ncbi:MAG: CopG family transcriptional regulator [Muribaculaceae bacterium]
MEKKLKIDVSWTEKNFCCGWSDEEAGTVVATNKSLKQLKEDFAESLKMHIQGCVEDGDILPEYLVEGNYELEFVLDAAALLRDAEVYTTMAAISRASGINQKLLSHYANGIKQPSKNQRERILNGLHSIGNSILALS